MAAKLGFHLAVNSHIHAYIRQKSYFAFEPQPAHKIGAGAFITVIHGHSGTKADFHDESFIKYAEGPSVDKVDVSGPTHLDLWFSNKLINGLLIRSDNDELRDDFVIGDQALAPTGQNRCRGINLTVGALAFLSLILLVIMRTCEKFQSTARGKNREILQQGDFSLINRSSA